jgi:hypothetical protein
MMSLVMPSLKYLRRVTAQVEEGQDGDRGLVRQRRGFAALFFDQQVIVHANCSLLVPDFFV